MRTITRANAFALRAACMVVALLFPLLLGAQNDAALLTGILQKVHPGFLEVSNGKDIVAIKTDAATKYLDARTDKPSTRGNLSVGSEVTIEYVKKDGFSVARKIRFLKATP